MPLLVAIVTPIGRPSTPTCTSSTTVPVRPPSSASRGYGGGGADRYCSTASVAGATSLPRSSVAGSAGGVTSATTVSLGSGSSNTTGSSEGQTSELQSLMRT